MHHKEKRKRATGLCVRRGSGASGRPSKLTNLETKIWITNERNEGDWGFFCGSHSRGIMTCSVEVCIMESSFQVFFFVLLFCLSVLSSDRLVSYLVVPILGTFYVSYLFSYMDQS